MDLPSVGVGKNVFAVDGITQLGVNEQCEKALLKGGDKLELVGDSGRKWGIAYRSTNESKNPIIISVGHRISLDTALKVTKACIRKFRIPEPVSYQDSDSL